LWRGNWIRGTAVHELGHALSLADNPPKSPSIMRYDRNRDLLISPTQYDKDEVKRIYKK
jgi:predicted Zn-dependent protease